MEQYRSASHSASILTPFHTGVPNTVAFAYGTSGAVGTATSESYLVDPDLIRLPVGDLISTASGTTSATVTNDPPLSTPRAFAVTGLMLARARAFSFALPTRTRPGSMPGWQSMISSSQR